MRMLIDKREEIREGDQVLVLDQSLGEIREHQAKVIDIRRVLGKPTYLAATGSEIADLWALTKSVAQSIPAKYRSKL